MRNKAYREIIDNITCLNKASRRDINLIKNRISKKYGLKKVPSNSELISFLSSKEKNKFLDLLCKKAVRKASGVTIIAVMSKPWPCPTEETCAYCPGGPSKDSPQSYTGYEPAAMRGSQNRYDPYNQVTHRILQYKAIGHKVDKIELIVMGGTFPSMPKKYQEYFIQRSLDAITVLPSKSLNEAQRYAEKSKIRNVGITLETRPDWAKERHVDQMLSMGVTRVEVGVQNVYDDIYKIINRGHTVKDVIEATRILKDSGLKVVYHMMPGLPGSNIKRDLDGFRKIFLNPDFKPDMLKIYPCLVIEDTKVFEWWNQGLYTPYTTEEAIKLIVKIKKFLPKWVRIMRIQRDIPAYLIKEGVKKSNLRELVQNRLKQENIRCRCIRCREVGHRWIKQHIKPDMKKIEFFIQRYKASQGLEFFISAEDFKNDLIIGYLRLRFPSLKAHRPEISNENTTLIRELRVCGPTVPLGKHIKEAYQHKGWGTKILKVAEKISSEAGYDKIIVTSALGTKNYYKRFGYIPKNSYMIKNL
jgi:elongator complex protein 3